MTARPFFRIVAASFALALGLCAQTTPELIGITAATPFLRTRGMALCGESTCAPLGFPGMAAHPAAGGTAYDPTRGGVWISNGTMVACTSPDDCRYLCSPAPLTGSRAFVSGLAVDEIRTRLWLTDTANTIHAYELRCPLTLPLTSCTASVPARHTIGGIATADVDGLVIWSSSDFSGMGPPGNVLYVAKMTSPCTPTCSTPLPGCGLSTMGPIHGVAYDQCSRIVWVTDGFKTLGLVLDTKTCALTPSHCCTPPTAEPFIGLCVKPSRATVSGRACVSTVCGPCTPTTSIGTAGDPAIGNPAFTFTLSGAPLATTAWLMLSFGGPCVSPGTPAPAPFCGLIVVDLSTPPIVVGPVTTAGLAACTGSAAIRVPVPASLALCGLHGCAQWIGICAAGAGGALSPGLSFALGGT